MNDFYRFLKLCAGRSGQLLNISSLATEASINTKTANNWLSYLTTSFIIHLVQPYYKNFNKKIIKTPKIFFNDPGLLIHLLGIQSPDQLALHPLRGAIFENLVWSELIKFYYNSVRNTDIWFWRNLVQVLKTL